MAFIPAAIASIGSFLGNMGLGTALSVGSSILGGVTTLASSNYNAQVAENNAKIARENAARATEQAAMEQMQADNETRAFIGEQEAAQSASGLSTTGRSQLLTRRSAQRLGRADATNIIRSGQAQATNFLRQETDFLNEAANQRSQGTFGLLSGVIGGASSLVGNAPSTRSKVGSRLRNDPWYGKRRITI